MRYLIRNVGRDLLKALSAKGECIVTAESCTGGMISAGLTDISGISAIYWGGFIVYDNAAKKELLYVDHDTLETFGAVSEETAIKMAQGALTRSGIKGYSLSVTGIAGPSGGTPDKPVGTVCFGVAHTSGLKYTEKKFFSGNRNSVRRKAVIHAFRLFKRLCLTGNT